MHAKLVGFGFVVVSTGACGGSQPPVDPNSTATTSTTSATSATSASSSPTHSTDSQNPPPALGAAFTVSELGLAGSMPVGDKCTPNALGTKLARLDCGTWAITLEVASAINDATVEGAQKTATQAWSSAKNFKSQTLPEGWQLMFEATGASAPEYHLKTYRTIGGKAYECDVNAKSVSERDKAIAVCGSLTVKAH